MPTSSSKYGTPDPKGRDDGSFTASESIYLDSEGKVATGDEAPSGGRLLVAKGKKLTMASARHHGLLDEGDGEATESTEPKPARKATTRKAKPEPEATPDAES